MSIVAMGLWAGALGNMASSGGRGSSAVDYQILQDELEAEDKKRAQKLYNPGVFSRIAGAEKSKPGDIFEKKTGNLSEDEKWLLQYELSQMKISRTQHREDIIRTVNKYNTCQITDIVKLYDTDPVTAAKIKPYLTSTEFSPAKLFKLYKKDEEFFRLMQSLGVIQGNFEEMYRIKQLGLNHLTPEYAQYKNPNIVKRLDEIAQQSPEKAKVVDSIAEDKYFSRMFNFNAQNLMCSQDKYFDGKSDWCYIYSSDNKPEVVDKFVDFYAKDKDFIKKLLTYKNPKKFGNKVDIDMQAKENKGKWLEYLVNVLEQFEQLEKKGVDKNEFLNGEMKQFIESEKGSKVDTLAYLKAKNREFEKKAA